MIRVDAHVVELEIERVEAHGKVFELVFVQIGPAPEASVNDVRKALSAGHL